MMAHPALVAWHMASSYPVSLFGCPGRMKLSRALWRAPKRLQDAPKLAQEAPRWAQEGSKRGQEGSKRGPRGLQEGPENQKKTDVIVSRFGIFL